MHKTGMSDAEAVKKNVVNPIKANQYLISGMWCGISFIYLFEEDGLNLKQSRLGQISVNNSHIFINRRPNFESKGSVRSEIMRPIQGS